VTEDCAIVTVEPAPDACDAPDVCAYCGKAGGALARATFLGAPKGGIPVHRRCVWAWFEMMDENGWRPSASLMGGQSP